ncbi:MAG TPA: choice-of-anchor P family protein [Thermoanaerobaculia bacterium]|nr:choice-of-anchor P family protein [Thermoanaerobaculia bacterium]
MSTKSIGTLLLVVVTTVGTDAFAGHLFNANAIAISGGGHAAVASVALPHSGGTAESAIRAYDDGFVRFAEARSVVHGFKDGSVAVTTSEITIVDLWFGDRIHADRVVARTNARQSVDDAEANIDFEGSSIENLTVDGVAVATSLDTAFFSAHPTFASLGVPGSSVRCSANGRASCGVAPRGLLIRGLGVLSIGDVFVKNGARHIQMLHLDRRSREGRVRSDDEGDLSVAAGSSGSNGVPIWP